jgi:hypothetical protein
MKLQVETVEIRNVLAGPKTHVSDHQLYVHLPELEKIILADGRIQSVNLDWVYPGDRVRIVNVVDVIQPRCKMDPAEEDFPGWLGKLKTAGEGRTRSLQGVSVILSNPVSKRSYSGIVDMYEKGAEWSKYGRLINLCVDPQPAGGTEERDFEVAVKLAGLKAAVYLAKAAEGHPADQVEVFDLDLPRQKESNLPRTAYAFLLYTPQHDYQGISDAVLYGTEMSQSLPLVLHPNEILDGGIVSPHTVRGMDTYSLQNHAIIKELYQRHGRDLLFAGVVVYAASLEPLKRQRTAMMVGHLVKNVLGADGVILNKVHGGMPHIDMALAAEACEKQGVKSALLIQFFESGTSLAEGALFNSQTLDAVVNVGQTLERIHLTRPDKILGGSADTRIYNPQFAQKADDAVIDIEGFLLAGFHDHLGGSKIKAVDY